MSRDSDNNRGHMHMLSVNQLKLIELAPLEKRYFEIYAEILAGGTMPDSLQNLLDEYRALETLITNVKIAKGVPLSDL